MRVVVWASKWVKKEQGINLHLISEIVKNGTTKLSGDILFFLYAHLDAIFTRIKFDCRFLHADIFLFHKAKLLQKV